MPRPATPLPDGTLERLNEQRGGFNRLIGLHFTRVSYDEVVAEVDVQEALFQPYGLVHGGVYAAMIETLASVGAAINAWPLGQNCVGLENTTSFVRAVREGRLVGRAVPVTRGRRTHVWAVTITSDDEDRVAARGSVRILCLESDAEVAGGAVAVEG
ncbi:MAG: PaaI family thioesterase [Myxococcota bacterium]